MTKIDRYMKVSSVRFGNLPWTYLSSHKQTRATRSAPPWRLGVGPFTSVISSHEPSAGRCAFELFMSEPERDRAHCDKALFRARAASSISPYFLMATVARIPAHRGRRPAHWLDSGQHGPRRPPRRGAVTVMTGSKRAIRTGHADLHPRQIPMTSAATRSAMTIRVPDAKSALPVSV